MAVNADVIDSASDMSTLNVSTSGAPAARIFLAAESNAGWPRAIIATEAPSAPRLSAIASPIPLLPPVTTAVAPLKPRSIRDPSPLTCRESIPALDDSGRQVHDLADHRRVGARNGDQGKHGIGHVFDRGHVVRNLAFVRPIPV
jgi:hypothetical protein